VCSWLLSAAQGSSAAQGPEQIKEGENPLISQPTQGALGIFPMMYKEKPILHPIGYIAII